MLSFLGNVFKREKDISKEAEEGIHRVNIKVMENLFKEEDLVGCSIMLNQLLETYGTLKKKNHRTKGREFVYFILSRKHKDLKNIGYNHWKNVNKIIHMNQPQVYQYHKDNLRNAIDFFTKELKGIKVINMKI